MDLRPMVMFLYMLSARAYTCGGFSYVACTCPCIMIYYDKPNEDSTDDDNIIMLPLSVTKYISLIFRIKFIFSWLTAPWYMSTSLFVKYFISCKILHFSSLIFSMFHFSFLILSMFHCYALHCCDFMMSFGNMVFCHGKHFDFPLLRFAKNWCFSGKPSGFWALFQVFNKKKVFPLSLCLRLAFASLLEKKRTFKCLLTGGNVSSVIYSQLL